MKIYGKQKSWALSLMMAVAFMVSGAHAQKMKIERLKGTKALVDISGGHVQVGDTFDLSTSKSTESKSHGAGGRENILGLSTNISSLSVVSGSSSVGVSIFSLGARYGWNKGIAEYGGIMNFASVSSNSLSTTSFYLGGFFDFNLSANRPPEDTVVGFGIEAGAGSANTSFFLATTSSANSASTWFAYPSGYLKWFGLGGNFCIRADLGLAYQSIQTSPVQTVSGLMGKVGLAQYF